MVQLDGGIIKTPRQSLAFLAYSQHLGAYLRALADQEIRSDGIYAKRLVMLLPILAMPFHDLAGLIRRGVNRLSPFFRRLGCNHSCNFSAYNFLHVLAIGPPLLLCTLLDRLVRNTVFFRKIRKRRASLALSANIGPLLRR